MEIGRKILNLRKDKGAPQKQLAEQTAVTPSALSRIEAGIHEPRGAVVLRLARHLGVTADYILDESAPYPPPAREILANLEDNTRKEPRETRIKVSKRERRILSALRKLEAERRVFLEKALAAPRDTVRYATFLLGAGADLPGIDEAELREHRERLGE